MKNLIRIICFLLLLSSCKKETDLIYLPRITESWRNWCGMKIACWGDSQTQGYPSVWSYPLILGHDLGIDSIVDGPGFQHHLYYGNVFNGGVAGENSLQIINRFMADTAKRTWAHIIGTGRNSLNDTASVLRSIDSMVAAMHHKKYFILEILNGNYPDVEWKGNPAYENITTLNNRIALKYPEHFLYIKPYLQLFALPNYEDSLAVAHDCVPVSLTQDELHINPNGNQKIVDLIIMNLLKCEPN